MPMTREQILAGIERLQPWFHRVELGPGLVTKTASISGEPADHPRSTWELVRRCLPENLAGKSVLDVGCNGGFYAVEAKRRGAGRVLGVDVSRLHVRQGLFVRDALGMEIDFQRMSVYDLSPRSAGRFDVVMALGLLYHCKHLILAAEKLFHVTKELLIVESAILPVKRYPAPFVYGVGGLQRTLDSMAYVENPADSTEAVYNWFLPSPEALRAILLNVGFDEVTISSVQNERVVLTCRRRGGGEGAPRAFKPHHLVAGLALLDAPAAAAPGAVLPFRLDVENLGSAVWPATGEGGTEKGAIRLGAHLLDENGEEIAWDWGRASFERDLAPGDRATVEFPLRAPEKPGRYFVEFDLVAEHISWFEELGSPILRHELRVGGA